MSSPRDIELVYNAAEVDQLVAAKNAEIHRLKRDRVDAVQNIQAHSMIVDASEKDAEIERLLTKAEKDKNTLLISLEAATKEIERLKAQNELDYEITVSICNENTDLKKLITDLCDALEESGFYCGQGSLVKRAREATR
jgi:uncharacterized small protein (DUF1192 family)